MELLQGFAERPGAVTAIAVPIVVSKVVRRRPWAALVLLGQPLEKARNASRSPDH